MLLLPPLLLNSRIKWSAVKSKGCGKTQKYGVKGLVGQKRGALPYADQSVEWITKQSRKLCNVQEGYLEHEQKWRGELGKSVVSCHWCG